MEAALAGVSVAATGTAMATAPAEDIALWSDSERDCQAMAAYRRLRVLERGRFADRKQLIMALQRAGPGGCRPEPGELANERHTMRTPRSVSQPWRLAVFTAQQSAPVSLAPTY